MTKKLNSDASEKGKLEKEMSENNIFKKSQKLDSFFF